MDSEFVFPSPLSTLLPPGFRLDEVLPLDEETLEAIDATVSYTDLELHALPEGFALSITVLIAGELALPIPLVEGLALVFGGASGLGVTSFRASIALGPGKFVFQVDEIEMALRLPPAILKPAPGPDGSKAAYAEISVKGGFTIDQALNLRFHGFDRLSLSPVMIGDTGIIISAENVRLDLSPTENIPEVLAAGFDESFIGIFLGEARIKLPEGLPDLAPEDLVLKNCAIGSGGVSGRLSAEYTPTYDPVTKKFAGRGSGELFSVPFALTEIAIEFKQGALIESKIAGKLLLSFFDHPVDVEIAFNLDGKLSVKLAAAGGLFTLEKEGLLSITLNSLGFDIDQGLFTARLSGSLTPLLGDFKWPTFTVNELSIDSKGNVRLEGGWLDLPSQYALDFHGFRIEISRIGFGKTDDGGKWIGFSGGLKLVEGLPAGASVEGLRVIWYDDGRQPPIRLTLEGVGIEFEIPEVLRFKGSVRFSGPVTKTLPASSTLPNGGTETVQRFDGAIKLELLTVNMSLEAALVVGQATGDRGDYGFFAIYLAIELPAGIPLGATGLALYGFAGLFATQMAPNRAADEGWYENADGGPGWYKRGTPGIVDLKTKWDPEPGSLALGAGTTIGTMPDNGQTFHGKILFVLVLPGPILMLEGRGDLLKKRSDGGATSEPLFRAIVVLDCRVGTLTAGLDVQYKYGDKGEMIDIRASVEAFFNFNDASAWHIYVGRKEPRKYRVLANLFQLFQANAYLMLDGKNPFFQTGAWIGYEVGFNFGPAALEISAFIQGDAIVSRNPVHFFAELTLHGSIKLRLFGFGFGLVVHAHAAADVFDPMHLRFDFHVALDLPWPLPDFSADFSAEWGPFPDPPPLPIPLKEIAVEHLKVTTSWPLRRDGNVPLLRPDYNRGDDFLVPQTPPPVYTQPSDFGALPIVPLDAKVHITFGRPVNDDAQVGVNPQPKTPEWDQIGDTSSGQGPARARFSLQEVALFKHTPSGWTKVAWSPNATPTTPQQKLYGSWAPMPTVNGPPGNVDQVKLWLWSKNPFDYTRHSGRAWDEWISAALPNYPCIGPAPEREECFDLSGVDPSKFGSMPWHPPGHPDITVIFQPVDGGTQVTIYPPGGATGVSVRPSARSDVTDIRRCADFRRSTPGAGFNPRFDFGMEFEVGVAGRRVPVLAASSEIITVPGADSGLATMLETQVKLPRSANTVEAIVSGAGGAAEFVAYRADGRVIDQVPIPGGLSQRIGAKGGGISRVVLRMGGEGVLHLLCFTYSSLTITGVAAGGAILSAERNDGTAVTSSDGVASVTITLESETELGEVCITLPPDESDVRRREEMTRHLVDETARWSQTGDVLEPDAVYRLKLVTQVEVESELSLRGFTTSPGSGQTYKLLPSPRQEQYAFFRTAGPPGIAKLSEPDGLPPGVPFANGLDDLSPYVRQTIPPTVPSPGQVPVLPRPIYRAYDVGVEFNEDYVDLMYRIARRDLSLYLYDANNQPVRDAMGRIVSLINRWGRTEDLKVSEAEERFVKTINAGTCAVIDESKIPRSGIFAAQTNGQILAADSVYEARLLPLLLHEDFSKLAVGTSAPTSTGVLGNWAVFDQGSTGAPSNWTIQESGTPASRFVTQTVAVTGGSNDGKDPIKPGTLLLAANLAGRASNDPTQPGNWSDFKATTTIRTTKSDGAAGVVFRHQGADTFYRFSMDGSRKYRRLVKVVNGTHSVLAEDDFVMRPNVDYEVAVEAIGGSLRLYQDGTLVFAVIDEAIQKGRFGLYSWGDASPSFADVRVDDLSLSAKPVYRFQFTTSEFTNFFHHLHSFTDETWRASFNVTNLRAAAVVPTEQPTEAETRAYESAAQQILGERANQRAERVQATRLEQGGQGVGFLLESPEPLNWTRTTWSVNRADRHVAAANPPDAIKITGVDFASASSNRESVSLLALRDTNLTGCRIERAQLPGPDTESATPPQLFVGRTGRDAGVLFTETFGPNALDRYEVIDVEPPHPPPNSYVSRWIVANNRIEQHNDYRGGAPMADTQPRRAGTLAILDVPFVNSRATFVFQTQSLRDIGVVFRFHDDEHYYRFSMARFDPSVNGSFRRLVKRVNGDVTVLWEDAVTTDTSQPTQFVIEAAGDCLVGYLNGALLFCVRDADIPDGRPGFYCWGNTQAFFEALEVESLDADPVLWQPALLSNSELRYFDEPGTRARPSNWIVAAGVVTQTSPIEGDDGAWESVAGLADDIGIGADGSVWSTRASGHRGALSRWTGQAWEDKARGGVRIAVDGGGMPWLVDEAGLIYVWNGTKLDRLPGAASDIGLGDPGAPTYIIGTNPEPGGYGVYYWDLRNWLPLPGAAVRIAVGPTGNPWVVNDANQIWTWDWSINNWQLMPGSASDISVGADGTLWIVSTEPTTGGFVTQRWNGLTWESVPGQGATSIAADPQGNPWVVSDDASLARWIGHRARKLGTHAVGGPPDLDDIHFAAALRSDSGGAIGVFFRYRDQNNYYRFSMHRDSSYRRLIKNVAGKITALWEDHTQFTPGRTYDVSIRAEGSWLAVHVDGQRLCLVRDFSFKSGEVGLYAHANPGARFANLLVTSARRGTGPWTIRDESTEAGPSRWRIKDGMLSQASMIGSADAQAAAGTEAIVGDQRWTGYRASAKFFCESGASLGILFRYQDEGNHYRLTIDAERKIRTLTKMVDGIPSRLWEGPGEYKTDEPVLLDIEAAGSEFTGYLNGDQIFAVTDLTFASGGVGIHSWRNSSLQLDSLEVQALRLIASALFRDHFVDRDASRWILEDVGPAPRISRWTRSNGLLTRALDPRRGRGLTSAQIDAIKSFAIVDSATFHDILVVVHVATRTPGRFGVIFHYQDSQNHLILEVDSSQGRIDLVEVVAGVTTTIWETEIARSPASEFQFQILTEGDSIRGYVDGVPAFALTSPTFTSGRVGLFCAADVRAAFSGFAVYPGDRAFAEWLLDDSFERTVSARWTFVDEGTQGGPSQWLVSRGKLSQLSTIRDASINPTDLAKRGTVAIAGNDDWADYRVSSALRSGIPASVGLVARRVDSDNFYRFELDIARGVRRLVKCVGGTFSSMWEDQAALVTGRDYFVTIDVHGDQIAVHVDGVTLFSGTDHSVSHGVIGLFCYGNNGAIFSSVSVAPAVWVRHYQFGSERPIVAGTRIRIHSEPPSGTTTPETGVLQRFPVSSRDSSEIRFPTLGSRLRVVDASGRPSHSRVFLPESEYGQTVDVIVSRKADGTGFFLLPAATTTLTEGEYRINLRYRRQGSGLIQLSQGGDRTDEAVTLDIPRTTAN